MKNTRYLARMIAFALSLLLLLGMIPTLATEAEPQIDEENLLSDFEAANSPEQLYQRHTSCYQHEDVYSGGELFVTDDMYITAESVYYFFGEEYVCYITPTSFIEWRTDEAPVRIIMTPEENAAKLQSYKGYFSFTEDEVLDSFEEQDGKIFFTTKITDADAVRAYLELKQTIFGEGFETDYGEGAEILFQYRADAADLTAFDFSETVCLPDGSELPLVSVTFTYDEALPDPAAPDSVLAPAFDETAGTRQIIVVFETGTPQEQICQYTVPMDIEAFMVYNGDYVYEAYADAECTQPFERVNGSTEYTIYLKGSEE